MEESCLPADECNVGEPKDRVKSLMTHRRLSWQGLGNAPIDRSIVTCVVYAAVMTAALVGKPELRYRIAHFPERCLAWRDKGSG